MAAAAGERTASGPGPEPMMVEAANGSSSAVAGTVVLSWQLIAFFFFLQKTSLLNYLTVFFSYNKSTNNIFSYDFVLGGS